MILATIRLALLKYRNTNTGILDTMRLNEISLETRIQHVNHYHYNLSFPPLAYGIY